MTACTSTGRGGGGEDEEVRIFGYHGIGGGQGGEGWREAGVSGGEALVLLIQKLDVAGRQGVTYVASGGLG